MHKVVDLWYDNHERLCSGWVPIDNTQPRYHKINIPFVNLVRDICVNEALNLPYCSFKQIKSMIAEIKL